MEQNNFCFDLELGLGNNGAWIVDRKGKIRDVNQAFLHLSGISKTDLLDKNVADIFAIANCTETDNNCDQLNYFTRTGHTYHRDYNVVFDLGQKKKRTFLVTEIKINRLEQKGANKAIRFQGENFRLMMFADISERADREAEIKKSVGLKSRFLADMAHEIRTPLSAIMGFSELLLENKKQDFESREKLQLIQKSSDILLELINDLLDFSKIEANKLQINPRIFNPRELVAHVRGLFAERIHRKGLNFQVDMDERIPERILADDLRIAQILINLLGNALKFTEIGAIEFTASLRENSGTIVYTVRDSGIGIDSSKQADIFEAYMQSNKNIQNLYGGTGLGLAISRQLASLMRGNLKVESELGFGSVFYLEIPFEPVEEQALAAESANPEEMEKIYEQLHPLNVSILVAEDNEINQKLTLHTLKKIMPNARIEIVPNGFEAMQMLGKLDFNLVITDIQMPVVNGLEFARLWKKQPDFYPVPIVVSSAESSQECREKIMKEGLFADYLVKPLERKQLLSTLYTVLLEKKVKGNRPFVLPGFGGWDKQSPQAGVR